MNPNPHILIIGSGAAGSRHADIAQQFFPSSEIKKIGGREFQEISYSPTSLAKGSELENFKPELIVIANPASEHLKTLDFFSGKGSHFLIEKPVGVVSDLIENYLPEKRGSNQTISVGYNLRFLNSLKFFRDQLKEGLIGDVLSVRCEVGQYLPEWRPGKDYRESVSASKKLGGGVIYELSHEIDYLRWVFGDIKWVRATTLTQSKLELEVEDTAHIILGLRGKVASREIVCSLNMDFVRRDKTRTCTAIGENATLVWDGIDNSVELFSDGSNTGRRLHFTKNQISSTYFELWKDWLKAIDKNIQPCVTFEDGLETLKTISAIKRSAKLGGITQYTYLESSGE